MVKTASKIWTENWTFSPFLGLFWTSHLMVRAFKNKASNNYDILMFPVFLYLNRRCTGLTSNDSLCENCRFKVSMENIIEGLWKIYLKISDLSMFPD